METKDLKQNMKITNEEKAMDIGDNYYDNDKSYTAQEAALEMAEWKDECFNERLKETLLNYTLWLERRGAFCEDLQIDWEHQIETFLELEQFSEENCRMNCGSQRCPGVFDEEWRKGCKMFNKKIEEELKND